MHINAKMHLLSNAIMNVALIKIIVALFNAGTRFMMHRNLASKPDMLETWLWHEEIAASILQIVAFFMVFFIALKKLHHYINLIPEEDRKEIDLLQREYLGDNLASLSVTSVNRLLQLWAVIFVGAEIVYLFTSMLYRNFISDLFNALSGETVQSSGYFVMIYNVSHGFKYLEILMALLLGVVMTGIFLSDRYLRIIAALILLLFLTAFTAFEMQTISLMGRQFGIVWTSIIYHITETAGLVCFALYLRKRYKGL